jgi:hypothetical protein
LNAHCLAAILEIIVLLALCNTAVADAPREGRWRELPEKAVPSKDAQLIEQLESIGYLARYAGRSESWDISVHFPAKAYQGVNLYASAHAPEAILMDMEGRTLHSWRFPYEDAFDPVPAHHDLEVLTNGNLLLFENNENSGHSQVVEIDPVDFDVRWSYGGSDEQPLYSKFLGAVQRLPNGNTLITESDAGRALEVTPKGEIAWQFHNPRRSGDRDQYIATLPEVLRLPADFAEGG